MFRIGNVSNPTLIVSQTFYTHTMRYSSRIATVLLLSSLLCTIVTIHAQQNDDAVLSIPPRLTVSQRKIGKDSSCTGICIREITSVEQLTPLPVLFFDHAGSALLTNRYQQFTHPAQADEYSDTDPAWAWEGTLAKYWQMLNIVGFRMRQHPQTTIAIEGGYSTQPGESPEIGMRRAETIRDYLTSIWKIDEGHIELREPKQGCDSSDHQFLQEEAQRVVIYSDSDEIFSLLKYKKKYLSARYLDFTITLTPFIPSNHIAEMTLAVWLEDSLLTREEFASASDIEHYRLHCMWDVHPQLIQIAEGPIRISGEVKTIDGVYHPTNTASIPIHTHRVERGLSDGRVLVPCFSFMGTTLNDFHRQFLDRYVRESTNEESVVQIVGISDPSELPESRKQWMRNYYGRAFDLPEDTLWRTWTFSTFPVESEEGVREYISTYHSPDWCATFGVIPTDSILAMQRAKSVAEQIAKTFKGVRTEVDASASDIIDFFALPEERWYGRGVYLSLKGANGVPESP